METELNNRIHKLRNQLAEEIAEHIIMSLRRNGITLSDQFIDKVHSLITIEIKLR